MLCNFSEPTMRVNASISAGSAIGSVDIVQQPAQILQRVGHGLQKVRLALVESAESVGAQRLHDANVNVGVVVAQKPLPVQLDESRQRVEIVIQQLLPQLRRQIGLAVKQKRGNVVLQRAPCARPGSRGSTARPSRSMMLRD